MYIWRHCAQCRRELLVACPLDLCRLSPVLFYGSRLFLFIIIIGASPTPAPVSYSIIFWMDWMDGLDGLDGWMDGGDTRVRV